MPRPAKTREIKNHHMDSTRWNGFDFRDDDIIIATYGKSGTTWAQQIVGQLLFDGADNVDIHELSPWLDLRIRPLDERLAMLAAQSHRRVVKTHLPLDALVFSEKAKYLYVARDARDVVWSLYNHHLNMKPEFYELLNGTPGLVGPPIEPPSGDVVAYFREWVERDGFPYFSWWENVRTWWAARNEPNVRLVHFEDLRRDLAGEIQGIAEFLRIPVDTKNWDRIVEHCTFDWMKLNADRTAPGGGALWKGGGSTFINKGTNGRWRNLLTVEDSARYDNRAIAELGEECARWLAHGRP